MDVHLYTTYPNRQANNATKNGNEEIEDVRNKSADEFNDFCQEFNDFCKEEKDLKVEAWDKDVAVQVRMSREAELIGEKNQYF